MKVEALQSQLVGEFEAVLGVAVELTPEYRTALLKLCGFLVNHHLRPATERRNRLLGHVNRKFDLNREPLSRFYSTAAKWSVVFSFLEKLQIQEAFDRRDPQELTDLLDSRGVDGSPRRDLESAFHPISEAETVASFQRELRDPSRLRRAKGDRPIDRDMVLAALSAFLFEAAARQVMHEYFDDWYEPQLYKESYWWQLRRYHPELYSRYRTLDIVHLKEGGQEGAAYTALRDRVLNAVAASYRDLANHGYLALLLEPQRAEGRDVSWKLASDVMLFAEKHVCSRLSTGYFNPSRIAGDTQESVPGVDLLRADFELANEGFTYRDTFVLADEGDLAGEEWLLLLFQKNERDETVIPCPACRSRDVRGNSYPTLGVKSWECRNPLCPERSKYNRGKRYSFRSLLAQEAMSNDANRLTEESVKEWLRDVQPKRPVEDILEMLIRHYSLADDGVWIWDESPSTRHRELYSRRIHIPGGLPLCEGFDSASFFDSAWFHRYATVPDVRLVGEGSQRSDVPANVHLILGDSADALVDIADESVAGAVTSPPYYNARQYSSWKNIYGYLYDMGRVAREVFRCLEPGGVFLYNIFDYFDNERTLAFSAMGDKRLILSALTVDLFGRIGFSLLGNITWDKGSIEGKRGFNGGNFSPYYQAPFNCWEHILVFAKHPIDTGCRKLASVRAVLEAKPVIKIVGGQNTHGHTAPFPPEIPLLIRHFVPPSGTILDPFAGSGTTATALAPLGYEVVLVERDPDYFDLMTETVTSALTQVELPIG